MVSLVSQHASKARKRAHAAPRHASTVGVTQMATACAWGTGLGRSATSARRTTLWGTGLGRTVPRASLGTRAQLVSQSAHFRSAKAADPVQRQMDGASARTAQRMGFGITQQAAEHAWSTSSEHSVQRHAFKRRVVTVACAARPENACATPTEHTVFGAVLDAPSAIWGSARKVAAVCAAPLSTDRIAPRNVSFAVATGRALTKGIARASTTQSGGIGVLNRGVLYARRTSRVPNAPKR